MFADDTAIATTFAQSFLHGTRADLSVGDLVAVGHASNFRATPLSWVYCTATLDAALWGAELARGDRRARIYVVEPTGPVFDDPNVTDTRFPGNPTLSYRSRAPMRVLGEVTGWFGHPAERVIAMRAGLAKGPRPIVD